MTDSRRLKILFAGDAALQKPYEFSMEITRIFAEHDLKIFNLEGAFSLEDNKLFKAGVNLKLDEDHIYPLFDNFDIAVLANNHIMDYGNEGLEYTISLCRENNIEITGAGINFNEAFQPIDRENCRIIAVAENEFGGAGIESPGIATSDKINKIQDLIREGKESGKFVVIVSHGGNETIPLPPPYLRERFRLWVSMGADMVIGNHPHVVQGYEKIDGKYVFYSLGNFVFLDEKFKKYKNSDWSIMISADVEKHEVSVIPVSFYDESTLRLAEEEKYLTEFKALSEKIISPDYYDEYRRTAASLFDSWYSRLMPQSKQDAALLLHYFRCDAHKNMIIEALSEKISEKQQNYIFENPKTEKEAFRGSDKKIQEKPDLDETVERPFLIIGAGSSGTTLLSVFLDKHPLLACGPEISVFNKRDIYNFEYFQTMLPKWLKNGLSTDGQAEYREFFFNLDAYYWTKDELIELSLKTSSLIDFFNTFYKRYLKKRDKFFWGEKSGSNAYCINEFLEMYPKARIIHLVRDGRDSVCSLRNRPNNIDYHCVSHWIYNVSASLAQRDREEYLEVKYEDLVSNPKHELKRICDHLKVDFDRKMLQESTNKYWENSAMSNIHKTWNNDPLSGKISTSSIDRYKTDMTPELEAMFRKVKLTEEGRKKLGVDWESAVDLMKMLGYEIEDEKDGLQLDPKQVRVAEMHEQARSLREFKFENRIWNPITYIEK